jgi:hypothetical protein
VRDIARLPDGDKDLKLAKCEAHRFLGKAMLNRQGAKGAKKTNILNLRSSVQSVADSLATDEHRFSQMKSKPDFLGVLGSLAVQSSFDLLNRSFISK